MSTRVGGVPEVLPKDMIEFAERPSGSSVVDALERAIKRAKNMRPAQFHRRVKAMYSWREVAEKHHAIIEKIISLIICIISVYKT